MADFIGDRANTTGTRHRVTPEKQMVAGADQAGVKQHRIDLAELAGANAFGEQPAMEIQQRRDKELGHFVRGFRAAFMHQIVEQAFAGQGLDAAVIADKKAFWRSAGLLLQNIGGFLGMLSLAKLAQVKGRRIAFALALFLSFISTLLVFRYMRGLSDLYWMLPLMGFGQLSVFGVYAVYLPELFPTSLRSTGTSFCYNVGRIVAATAPFTMSQITKRLGGDIEGFRTAGMCVSLVLLAGIAVLPFLPETKDQPLPEE